MLNFNTFRNSYSPYKNTNNNNNVGSRNILSSFTRTNFSNSKLRPLAKDTISFTSKGIKLDDNLRKGLNNKESCAKVHHDAEKAAENLSLILCDAMNVVPDETMLNAETSELTITTRIKSPRSIAEKVAEKIQYALTDDINSIFKPQDTTEIKKNVGDIVGSRIVLQEPNIDNDSKVIDKLIEKVESGELKILSIENYSPRAEDSELKYFKDEDLLRLKKAAEKANGTEVKLTNKVKPSGYMALHIDVDLSNDNLSPAENQYKGEIQIMGREIEKFKELEDVCYKLKQDKEIKSGHPAFKVLSDYFKNYLKDTDEYTDVEKNFMAYTNEAYKVQRLKEIDKHYVLTGKSLPTLEECKFQGKIPPELDFNTLDSLNECSNDIYCMTRKLYDK